MINEKGQIPLKTDIQTPPYSMPISFPATKSKKQKKHISCWFIDVGFGKYGAHTFDMRAITTY